MVTVVTEAIFSYCGVKVKIDTDRHLGPETATVRAEGEAVGHVTTARVRLADAVARRGRAPDRRLEGRGPGDLRRAAGALQPRAGGADRSTAAPRSWCRRARPPVVDGVTERRMRVGCGSATIGMFAAQWQGLVDEVVVVDDHITGVVSEHQAGKVLGWAPTGIRIKGHRSTPGRYFRVSEPGLGWGGTRLDRPAGDPRRRSRPEEGRAAGADAADGLHHRRGVRLLRARRRPARRCGASCRRRCAPTVALIDENCEPALCTVLFMGGAGGSLRAGVTANPVRLTRAVQARVTRLTCGGAPVYVWPGGGITFMVDVTALPERRLRLRADAGAGGAARVHHAARAPISRSAATRRRSARSPRSCATAANTPPPAGWSPAAAPMTGPQVAWLPDGRRLHLHHGPIDLILEALGRAGGGARGLPRGGRALRRAAAGAGGRAAGAAQRRSRGRCAGRSRGRWRRAVAPHRAGLHHADGGGGRGGGGRDLRGDGRARRRSTRAYVNDGGDIALHLAPGRRRSPRRSPRAPGCPTG